MYDWILSARRRWRFGRLVEAMTRHGVSLPIAIDIVRFHRERGTLGLLEQEWLS